MYTLTEEENKNLFQKTLDDLKTQIKFVGTFGFGITGLYETVQELLYGKYPTLSEHEIILIFLAALSYFSINVIDDVKKLNKIVQEKGLKKYLTQTVETLKDFENLAIEIGKKAGHTISSLAELVGYIYLLIPILETVQRLVAKEGFDIVTLGIYLKSILTSVGIFYTKNIFDKLIGRLKRNIPKDNKDVIKEHTERKDELRRVLDKYEKDYKRVSPELIIDLAMEDPSTDYDYLDWTVDQVKMGFFLGVDLKYISRLINKFHLHKDILTKGRILRILDRFKMMDPGPWVWNNDDILAQILEDPSDINNYPGYGQVEQILQMIDFSIGSSEPGTLGPDLQLEQLDYLQKKGEQSTRKVVGDILKIIKEPDAEEEFYHLPDYFSGIDGDMYEFGELEFNVYLNIVEYDSLKEPFIVDAEMGGDYDDEIYVTITIGPKFSDRDYEDIQMVLNDYVRHEIEHVIDATEGGDIESPDNLSPYDYYMQPHEVRAQKAGFNRKAKLEKKPVEDIIYDYLEYRQKIDKLSDEEKSNLTKTLSEHKEPGLNPELTYGDTILVVDIDREREDGKTTYTSPGEQMRPERYTPYTVVDKETNGHKSQWPFRYTLVPPIHLEAYEKSLDRGWGNYEGYEKQLFPWIYQWIYADTPTATGVDRKTISEHKESKINPDLDKGDIIRVIEIDGEHANMPKRWGIYKVHDVLGRGGSAAFYYQLSGETAELIQDRLMNAKYLYPGDTWIPADTPMATNVDRLTLSEHKGKGERYNQPLEEGDIIELIYMDDPYNPISPLTRGVVMGFEKVPGGEDKILVTWIVDPENDKMFNMPMIPEVDVWMKLDVDPPTMHTPTGRGSRDSIGRPLREQTDPTFGDKVWDAVKDVGKLALKNNGLSWLIRKVVGATPTKARLIFPKEGWETTAVKILENIGVVTGTYETLDEANNFFKDLKQNGCDNCLEELLIGSHGYEGNLLTTQKGGRKGYKERWDAETRTLIPTDELLWETGKRYAFKTDFLEHIKPVVNPNTKVYFTACHGADKLTMLKEAADELGCECYACMGNNAWSFRCEGSNWSCNANTGVESFEFSGQQSEDERAVITGEEGLSGYQSAKAFTNKVNDFYVEHKVCQEQPNISFNWVTLFG